MILSKDKEVKERYIQDLERDLMTVQERNATKTEEWKTKLLSVQKDMQEYEEAVASMQEMIESLEKEKERMTSNSVKLILIDFML
jgi:chromosome segregation ATPase